MALLSVAFLTIPDLSPLDAIRMGTELGFQRIGVRLIPAVLGESPYPLLTDIKIQREVIAALSDSPISIADVELIRINALIRVEDFAMMFDVANSIGAQFVTVINDDPVFDRAADSFCKLAELALEYNLTLNLEPMRWTALNSITDALAIVSQVPSDNAAILIDSFHFSRCAMSIDQLALITPANFRMIQLCDAPLAFDSDPKIVRAEARSARHMPGDGQLPLVSMLSALPIVKNETIVSVEVPSDVLRAHYTPKERLLLAKSKTERILKKLNLIE